MSVLSSFLVLQVTELGKAFVPLLDRLFASGKLDFETRQDSDAGASPDSRLVITMKLLNNSDIESALKNLTKS